MISILSTLALLSGNAYALGPIPIGTYTGTEVCNMGSFATRMTLTNDTLEWDGQVNAFDLKKDPNGFFEVHSTKGMKGKGLGHFTTHGLHYEIVFDFKDKTGTHPAPGEDTLSYENGVIHLESSASAGPKGKYTCTGDFAFQP